MQMLEATMAKRRHGGQTRRYPKGSATRSFILPKPVSDAIDAIADERHASASSVVAPILEAWLKAQGRLPLEDE